MLECPDLMTLSVLVDHGKVVACVPSRCVKALFIKQALCLIAIFRVELDEPRRLGHWLWHIAPFLYRLGLGVVALYFHPHLLLRSQNSGV